MFQATRNVMRKYGAKVATAGAAVMLPVVAFAQTATPPSTLKDLTDQISLANATGAVLAIALIIIGFLVLKQGAHIVLAMIHKAR